MHDVHAAVSPGSLSYRASFRRQQCVIRRLVRSDDLITFGAENGESLVSAILSVKYSMSAWYAVHGSVLPRPGRCRLRAAGETT
jgi:hypothetical protein